MLSIIALFLVIIGTTAAQQPPGIWRPQPGSSSWQWQLASTGKTYSVDTSYNVQMYDIDMFEVSAADINKLKADGRVVICYIDVGSWESGRPDSSAFPPIVKSKKMDRYPEYWFDISQIDPSGSNPTILQKLLYQRFQTAKTKGCHGIEPDNVDAYLNSVGTVLSIDGSGSPVYGPNITVSQSVAFIKWVSASIHQLGMSVGLKNAQSILHQVGEDVDWALNEQCNEFNECGGYHSFIASGKSVFNCEYDLTTDKFCSSDNSAKIDGILKTLELYAQPLTFCRSDYVSGPVCGDNLCVTGEENCPKDCGASSNAFLSSTFDGALLFICIVAVIFFIVATITLYRFFTGKADQEPNQAGYYGVP